MAVKWSLLLVLVVLRAATWVGVESVLGQADHESLNRNSFPEGFIFGTATSAYQIEGAANEGGRGPSIWDTFTHTHPEKIADGSNADVAVDSYHRYEKDVEIMKDMGMDAYRFSISWSRILPKGNLHGGVNKEGIKYYNNLIDQVVSKGLKPFVTLFHWDVPQFLEDQYGGFLSLEIVEDFKDFVDICFWKFGDRVKHWITLNEPYTFSTAGYARGYFAPGRCSPWEAGKCSHGDSGTEPYNVTHNLLLAHAAAVQLYRTKYQEHQRGIVGITLITNWFVPYNFDSELDYYAAKRAIDFMFGWYMEPLTRGDYPHTMKIKVGDRLPKFTEEESSLVNGSFDFIGVNYYTTQYAKHVEQLDPTRLNYNTDAHAFLTAERHGVPIGPQATGSKWLFVYPRGLLELLVYTAYKYNNPVIYITENGVGDHNNASLPLPIALDDKMRVDYYRDHLSALLDAIRSGVDVRGYFAWSLLDNFEWADGYTVRFGLTFVDYQNDLKRYRKHSATWFKKFLKKLEEEEDE